MAASLHSIPPQRFLPLGTKLCSKSMPKPTSNPQGKLHPVSTPPSFRFSQASIFPRNKQRPRWGFTARAVPQDLEVVPVRSTDSTDRQNGVVLARVESDQEAEAVSQVGGFGDEARLSLEGAGREIQGCSSSGNVGGEGKGEVEDVERFVDKAINATVVLAAGSFAITKLLTIDHDYWHGWTVFEILRYAPQHNWSAYEEALKANPVFAKMMISGIVYSIGDWIAQCVEGRPLFDFDRARMFRSGLVGFTLHGSISHYYYQFCEALFPFHEWWVVPAKVAFDQTLWAITWNSIYYAVLGFLRFESPASVFSELKATSWPMLTAGWKLWPFAHVITYGVVPVEQRLLWVDCVELIWVTILSTYSNAKSKARVSEAAAETHSRSVSPPEE